MSKSLVNRSPVTGWHAVRGFSLIELLVVIAILGLLVGIVGPRFIGQHEKAKPKAARLQIDQLGAALDIYRLDVGHYPSTANGLEALISAPSDAANWNGPYLKKKRIPQDPWGHDYQYRAPGEHGDYDLYSYGADGTEGGDKEAQDIDSWD